MPNGTWSIEDIASDGENYTAVKILHHNVNGNLDADLT